MIKAKRVTNLTLQVNNLPKSNKSYSHFDEITEQRFVTPISSDSVPFMKSLEILCNQSLPPMPNYEPLNQYSPSSTELYSQAQQSAQSPFDGYFNAPFNHESLDHLNSPLHTLVQVDSYAIPHSNQHLQINTHNIRNNNNNFHYNNNNNINHHHNSTGIQLQSFDSSMYSNQGNQHHLLDSHTNGTLTDYLHLNTPLPQSSEIKTTSTTTSNAGHFDTVLEELIIISKLDSSQHQSTKLLCPIEGCVKSFDKKSNLRSHLTCHSITNVTFDCKVCFKKFKRLPDLYRHQRSIHGEGRQLVCVVCNKGFGRMDTLKKHLVVCGKQRTLLGKKQD